MAYDLILRQTTPRSFARDSGNTTLQPYSEGLLGLGTITGILILAAFKRHREISDARVRVADPHADITQRIEINPSMHELLYRRRAT